MQEQRFSVVVPTAGGPGLKPLLAALADSLALADRAALDLHEIVVVDDRAGFPERGLDLPEPGPVKHHVHTVRTGGRGPAAARNAGWRSTSGPWVVFVDDDTDLTGAWADDLVADLEGASPAVGAVTARGADGTAVTDVAFRRELLARIHGFDERREVAELAGRAERDGWLFEAGTRVSHAQTVKTVPPVPAPTMNTPALPAPEDSGDARAVDAPTLDPQTAHARVARARTDARAGDALTADDPTADDPTTPGPTITTTSTLTLNLRRILLAGAAALALAGLVSRRRSPALAAAAGVGALGLGAVGLRTPGATDLAPRSVLASSSSTRNETAAWPPEVRAVVFDLLGTLVHESGPDRFEPTDTAREALDAARRAGLRTGIVTADDTLRARVDEQLGPFDTWLVGETTPALLLDVARALGVEPWEVAFLGDEPADAAAAHAAGARSILVPNGDSDEGTAETAANLAAAVARLNHETDLLGEG